ncbi:tRNA (N(6)-L-threonylcarbamoyladenosine(37)-C(2))-methylthiotransferase MtaB [Candidatus Odyssella acanthamoebae]|uniref:2-methylthioadenine synthase n=1 Tax=Candidatus Odyssella acanthamoebae TaxID=91604 RepID=A0A077AYS9_9PROT|nr:tRNA (N(6)-L-threonylcarbamoyladenosine(37)-C(2))-methylthiotransferase MtaB [Candidatus Paracaedibacter acanthamoebae]AIK96793.1 2-methylthioadenine synthase [Candidatus Paracaedibacter acanthamoebae]
MTKNIIPSPEVITFGCRLNTYESQVMKDLATQAGLNNAFIINTCAVTSEAERQARQTIRKLRRENPDAEIIVTGCASQINPGKFADMPEVSRVIGNDEKMQLSSYAQDVDHERVLVNDIMSVTETAAHLISGFDGKARAFVQIQNGCDHRCTFCTIPYGRGNSRSVPIGEIVNQVKILIQNGYPEIALTGVDITAYGADLPGKPTLGQMVRRLLALVPDLQRLRLSSLDPVEMDDDLWDLIGNEPRLLPHLHMSLQAGDNMILKRMKRRHLREDAIGFCKKARTLRPDCVFGVDLIAGFPTETDEMFENTLNIVDDCDLTFLHVFPYSPRPGTPAARMPQIKTSLIKERAARLRAKGDQAIEKHFKSMQGKTVSFLVESCENGFIHGKTDQFAPITVVGKASIANIAKAKVISYTQDHLIGNLVDA